MRCSKAKIKISEFVDDELNTAQEQLLKKHLMSCSECKKLYEDFIKIKEGAKGLVELSPSGQAWFKIAGGIKEKHSGRNHLSRVQKKRFVFSPSSFGWGVTASLALGLIVIGVIFVPKLKAPAPGSEQYVVAKLEEAERYYQKAIDALWEVVSVQKENFDPQLYAVFQKNLGIIDESIAACREAVLSSPNSLDSRNYLLAAYKEKRALLEDMMAVSPSPVDQRDVGSIY